MENLNFLNNNPGSSQHGNFINYYKFHTPEERIKLLRADDWNKCESFTFLDIGCNCGDLTVLLYDFITKNVSPHCHCLAIDIDPVLIERAIENRGNRNITYTCLNFMNDKERTKVINNYLEQHRSKYFSTTFCFSITMWIHLNHGDEGLRAFLRNVYDICEIIVIEPQAWKCYRNAVKRMKSGNFEFPLIKTLQIRSNVEIEIENILTEQGAIKVKESERNDWRRKIIFFKRSD